MDQLSASYVKMVCGPQSMLEKHDAVVTLVEELKAIKEKSSALRKNFLIDTTTPHGDAVITESSVMKPGVGWVTVQVTEGIRQGIHEWCIVIENQGETTDGSGLMVGVVPKSFSKHDSFISQGGGWCISRAGKLYGHWRRQDSNNNSISFGTGDRVIFTLDYNAAKMSVRVGNKCVVGDMSNLTCEVFPAVSLHYRNQHIRYEYHIVRDKKVREINWFENNLFPEAASFLPLSVRQLNAIGLNHYVYCPIFVDKEDTRAWKGIEHNNNSENGDKLQLSYHIPIVYNARFEIVYHAMCAVRMYAATLSSSSMVGNHLDPEYLRKQAVELQRAEFSGLSNGGYDASANCGAILLIHLFTQALTSPLQPISTGSLLTEGLLNNLMDYLVSLPPFSLAEVIPYANTGAAQTATISPLVSQLACDNIWNLLNSNTDEKLSETRKRLLEVFVILSFQRGLISEVLRACRLLFQFSSEVPSARLQAWFQDYIYHLSIPRVSQHNALCLQNLFCEDLQVQHYASLANMSGRQVLSVGFSSTVMYLHTDGGLSKWENNLTNFALVKTSKQPLKVCTNASRSSLAIGKSKIFLLTDLMAAQNVALVSYTHSLEVLQIITLHEVDADWPKLTRQLPVISSGALDKFVVLYARTPSTESEVGNAEDSCNLSTSNPKGRITSAKAKQNKVEIGIQLYQFDTFPKVEWTDTLRDANNTLGPLKYCLAILPSGAVNLGNPENILQISNGHVMVEIWVQVLQKDEHTKFYCHGDCGTSGEVFIETATLEGVFCVRGGFRHDVRGTSTVSAPLPLHAQVKFLHIGLSFDGRWHLFFDGEEVAVNRSGPHVSLQSPKQVWKVGGTSSFVVAGLRVWTKSRTLRETARDRARVLPSTEQGLALQLFFNESDGNVVYNYASASRTILCTGATKRLMIANHPFRSNNTASLVECVRDTNIEWKSLQYSRGLYLLGEGILGLSIVKTDINNANNPHVFFFFDLQDGCRLLSETHYTSRTAVCTTADEAGNIWQLSKTGAANFHVSLSNVSIDDKENDGGITNAAYHGHLSLTLSRNSSLKKDEADTLGGLALKILQIITLQSISSNTNALKQLYTPLADDVGKNCVSQIKNIVMENVKVVKSHNARRTLTLTNSFSSHVIASAMCVLLRLISRVKEFHLDPNSVGLTVLEGDQEDSLFSSIRELYNYSPRRASQSKNSLESTPADATTLLSILTDIINESGNTLDENLGCLAEVVLSVGVELFLPTATIRAKLLRDAITSVGPKNRPRSLEILLNSIIESFSSISNAQALLWHQGEANLSSSSAYASATLASSERLDEISSTLDILLSESVAIMRNVSEENEGKRNVSNNRPHHLLSSLARAIDTLQLILLSYGSRDAKTSEKVNIFSFVGVKCDAVVKFYASIFKAAREGLEAGKQYHPAYANSFLFTSLHVAFASISAIATFENASVLLRDVEGVEPLLSQWIPTNMGRLGDDEKRRIKSTHDSMVFMSCWLSCFMSIPNVRQPIRSALNAKPMENSQKLIKSGIDLETALDMPIFLNGFDKSAKRSAIRRDFVVAYFKRHSGTLRKKQEIADPLAVKMPPALFQLMETIVAASLFLSNIVRIHLLTDKKMEKLATDTLHTLIPHRNDLFAKYGKDQKAYNEFETKCKTLFQLVNIFDTDFRVDFGLTSSTTVDDTKSLLPQGPAARWKFAVQGVKYALLLHRAQCVTRTDFNLEAVMKMVIAFSCSDKIEPAHEIDSLQQCRERMAQLRIQGFSSRIHRTVFSNDYADLIASISKGMSETANTRQFTERLGGCSFESIALLKKYVYENVELLINVVGKNATAKHPSLICLLDQSWKADDFAFLTSKRVCRILFLSYCSLFESTTKPNLKSQDNSSQDEERRATAKLYYDNYIKKLHQMNGDFNDTDGMGVDGKNSSDDGSEEKISYVVLNENEENFKNSLTAFKHLGIQAIQNLSNNPPIADELVYTSFLKDLMDTLTVEVDLCSGFLHKNRASTSAVDANKRVERHVNLLVTLLTCIVSPLSDKHFYRLSLCRSAAILASSFYSLRLTLRKQLFVQESINGAALFKLITLLLRNCYPYVCNEIFYTRFMQSKECTRVPFTANNATVAVLFSALVDTTRLARYGNELNHNILSTHKLLLSDLWSEQLSQMRTFFQEQFAASISPRNTGKGSAGGGRTAQSATSAVKSEEQSFKGYVCMAVLSGKTLFEPSLGNCIHFKRTGNPGKGRAYIVHLLDEEKGLAVITYSNGNKKLGDYSKHSDEQGVNTWDNYIASAVSTTDDACTNPFALEKETTGVIFDGEDIHNVFESDCVDMFNPEEEILPFTELPNYLSLAIKKFFSDNYDRTWSVTDLSAAFSTLYITLNLIQKRPQACEKLLGSNALLFINRFLTNVVATSPIPVPYLSSYIIKGFKQFFSLSSFWLAKKNEQIPADSVVQEAMGDFNTVELSITSEFAPTVSVLHRPPSTSLCFLTHGSKKGKINSYVNIKSTTDFPLWEKGVVFELSVFLRNLYAPELGEYKKCVSYWGAPNIEFDLLSLYMGEHCFLKVTVETGLLVCVLSPPQGGGSPIKTQVELFSTDWDIFLHIAVVLDNNRLSLSKTGDVSYTKLPSDVAKTVQELFTKQNTITHVIIGNVGDPSSTDEKESNSLSTPEYVRVILAGFKMKRGKATEVLSKLNSLNRDGTLTSTGVIEDCFFQLCERTGDTIISSNSRYTGQLNGSVFWTPTPLFKGNSLSLNKPDKLLTGLPTEMSSASPSLFIRRYLCSLELPDLSTTLIPLLSTSLAFLSRKIIASSFQQFLGPAYRLNPKIHHGKVKTAPDEGSGKKIIFNPFLILEPHSISQQIANCFSNSATGVLSREQSELIELIVDNILSYCEMKESDTGKKGDGGALAASFFTETANSLCDALINDRDLFLVRVPQGNPGSSAGRAGSAERGVGVFPIPILSCGDTFLSFDSKTHGIESAVIYKDEELKSTLKKYPDSQGGWSDLVLEAGFQWLFAELRPVQQSQEDNMISNMAFTVSTRSLMPVVFKVILNHLFGAFYAGRFQKYLSCFLNSQTLLTLLSRNNNGASGEIIDRDNTHLLCVLNGLMELWTRYPEVSPFDHIPLPEALIHVNVTLSVMLLRDCHANEIEESLASASLDTYNSYTQKLFSLMMAAINLEEAWTQVSYAERIRTRFKGVFHLWKDAAVSPLWPTAAEKAQLTPEAVFDGPPVSVEFMDLPREGSPITFMSRKGSGEIFVRCDKKQSSVRSQVGFTKGRFYFEVRVTSATDKLAVGVTTSKSKLFNGEGGCLGDDSESWAFDNVRRSAVHNNNLIDGLMRGVWQPGDEIGIHIDLETNRLTALLKGHPIYTFRKFRTSSNVAVFPAVTFGVAGCEINFGSAPFKNIIPLGFVPVDPRSFASPDSVRIWSLVMANKWADALKKENVVTTSTGTPQHCVETILRGKTEEPVGSLDDSLCFISSRLLEWSESREGPLRIECICPSAKDRKFGNSELHCEEGSFVSCGAVVVKKGKWYYELALLGEETEVSVGWVTGGSEIDFTGRKALGDDESSWVLESKRMIARHNKHQSSLTRHNWNVGDVIGCLLDFDAMSISFSINGVEQKRPHDLDGALFEALPESIKICGLSPVVSVHSKTSVECRWEKSELLYMPEGFAPLGATGRFDDAVAEYYLFGGKIRAEDDKKKETIEKSKIPNVPLLQRILKYISQNTEVSPMNRDIFTPERLLFINKNNIETKSKANVTNNGNKNSEEVCALDGVSMELCKHSLAVLNMISNMMEVIYPYAHKDAIPLNEECCLYNSDSDFGILQKSYMALKTLALPYWAIEQVNRFVTTHADAFDIMKLTVNRRKALTVLSDHNSSTQDCLKESLFGQVHSLLSNRPVAMFRTNKKMWSISFIGEGADDVGGPYRESITQLCNELMGERLPLFIPSPNQQHELGDSRELYVINPSIASAAKYTEMFHFIGRLMGGCLRSGEILPLCLNSTIWKSLVNEPFSVEDVQSCDAALVRFLRYLAETATTDESVFTDINGYTTNDNAGKEVELFPGGRAIPISSKNYKEYICAVMHFHLYVMAQPLRQALCYGFWEIVPLCCLSNLKWYVLEQWVCGRNDYDANLLLDNAIYDEISPKDARVVQLREVLTNFTRQQRAMFMRFISGRERMPQRLQLRILPDVADDMNSTDKDQFNSKLPHASTCFYQLVLPRYGSSSLMREKLLLAIEHCLDIDADFQIHEETTFQNEIPGLTRVNNDDDEFEDYSHLQYNAPT